MIRIVNLRNYVPMDNEVLIKIDRSSFLGNPYYMSNESKRDEVCNKYEIYFKNKFFNDMDFQEKFLDLIKYAQRYENIALGCWCYPKRCHGNTVKRYLEFWINKGV